MANHRTGKHRLRRRRHSWLALLALFGLPMLALLFAPLKTHDTTVQRVIQLPRVEASPTVPSETIEPVQAVSVIAPVYTPLPAKLAALMPITLPVVIPAPPAPMVTTSQGAISGPTINGSQGNGTPIPTVQSAGNGTSTSVPTPVNTTTTPTGTTGNTTTQPTDVTTLGTSGTTSGSGVTTSAPSTTETPATTTSTPPP